LVDDVGGGLDACHELAQLGARLFHGGNHAALAREAPSVPEGDRSPLAMRLTI